MRKSKYMTFKEWLNIVLDKGLICERYLPDVDAARSRKQFMDIALDVNGMEFLCDMGAKGYKLPYETMRNEFVAYMNGRYIRSKSSSDGGYTSSMYCSIEMPSEITVNTTLTGLFDCRCTVYVPEHTVCQVYVDSGSNIQLHVPTTSKCYVEVWNGGGVVSSGGGNVYIKHKCRDNE